MATTAGRTKIIAATAIAIAVTGFGGWQYYHSPNQVATRQLQQAAQARSAGQIRQAAALYADVARTDTDVASQGSAGLRGLLDPAVLQALPAADAASVLEQSQRARGTGHSPMLPKDVLALGWTLVAHYSAKDPAGAKAVLDVIAPLEADKAKLASAAEPLLDRMLAANPGNAPAAIELATLLDKRHDCARCESLLATLGTALAHTEGARILGQIYAVKGKLDESYALLQPYTDDKLKVFVQQEAQYRDAFAAADKAAIETLRTGKGTPDFYRRYEQAADAGKRELVSAYVNAQLSANGNLKSLAQSLRESATIVPVALDLGIVTVQRAQKLSDAKARNDQFAAAEKVFLAIRGVAGDTDGYRLYLGQVYYWLGKQDEGKKLFDALLESHHREFGTLINVASILRAVGALQDARALMEEAYRGAKDNEQRWAAAHMRSISQIDLEDQITWLERSDHSDLHVSANIHNTRAMLAQRKGQLANAKREFELALGEYAKQPESESKLNNAALVHLSIYAIEGDTQHRDQGLALLDQALAMSPADSILLLNNISAVSSSAMAAMVGEKINAPLLRTGADIYMLEFLHNDETSRNKVYQALRANEAVQKALSYSEKAALLAPRNPESYSFQVTLYTMLEDAPAMKATAEKAQASHLDLTDLQSRMKKYADGVDLKQNLEALQSNSKNWATVMQQPALEHQGTTWAVAAGRWVDAQASLAQWGQTVDPDAMVKIARKARSVSPSSGTHSMLIKALETRAALHLMKTNSAFASAVAKHGRIVDFSTLMSLHREEDPEFRRQALADTDFVEIMAMVRERDQRYPSKASTWAWALFHHADTAYAQTMANRIQHDATYASRVLLTTAFEPNNLEEVIQHYLYVLAVGDKVQAQRVLDDARKASVALPTVMGTQLKA